MFAPYQVDDAVIVAFRDGHPADKELLAGAAWASCTAIRRIAGWLAPTPGA